MPLILKGRRAIVLKDLARRAQTVPADAVVDLVLGDVHRAGVNRVSNTRQLRTETNHELAALYPIRHQILFALFLSAALKKSDAT